MALWTPSAQVAATAVRPTIRIGFRRFVGVGHVCVVAFRQWLRLNIHNEVAKNKARTRPSTAITTQPMTTTSGLVIRGREWGRGVGLSASLFGASYGFSLMAHSRRWGGPI